MTDMKNALKSTHRFVFSMLQTDNTGVSADDLDLFDRSQVTPEEQAHAARNYYDFRDFFNDPDRTIRYDASFRLFKRGNRLLAVEKVQQGWWECRYFAARRVQRRKADKH